MMRAACRRLFRTAAAGLLLALTACSALNQLPPEQRSTAQLEAQAVLEHLAQTNASLSSFKGIGRIRLQTADHPPLSERVAWIASPPDRLGLAVLAAGRPVVRVAADGQHLYLFDLQDPQRSYQRLRTSDARLDRLIHIPITVSEVVAILAGRAPIRNHSRAFLREEPPTRESVLVLERWWRVVEKIYLDADRRNVRRVEMLDGDGKTSYRIDFEEMQNVQGYRVPRRLALSGGTGSRVQLEIEHYSADVPVTASMFVLPPPDSPSP